MRLKHQHAGQAPHPVDICKAESRGSSHRATVMTPRGSIQNTDASTMREILRPAEIGFRVTSFEVVNPRFVPQLIAPECPKTFPVIWCLYRLERRFRQKLEA